MFGILQSPIRHITATVRRDPVLTTLLILAATYFLLCYITNPVRPADIFTLFGWHDYAKYPLGWFGYHDQGVYLSMAHTLANLNFSKMYLVYGYGVGYPLVAVPALWLGFSKDPFVFFNLFVYVFSIYAVYRVAKWLLSPVAGLLAGFGLMFATPLIHYVDQPWNSTVCLLAISGIMLLITVNKVNRWHALIAGLLIGWAFAARYIDVVWLGAMAMASLYRGSWKELFRQGVFVFLGLMLWVIPVLYSHYRVFGSPLRTPYVYHLDVEGVGVSDQQLGAYSLRRIPDAATGMFVGPRLKEYPDTDRGLLVNMFWGLAAIPGAIVVLRRKQRKLFWGVFAASTIVATLFYLSFRASTPYSLQYGVLHYFKMFWPGIVILAVAFFDKQLAYVMKRPSRRAKPQD